MTNAALPSVSAPEVKQTRRQTLMGTRRKRKPAAVAP
jgi:hypothetical protein